MARRVIATAEVEVQSNVAKAEEGLQDLVTTFRRIGANAERAAERAEVAMFASASNMRTGLNRVVASSEDLLDKMSQTDRRGKEMAASLRQAVVQAQKLSETDFDEGARQALRVFKEIVQVAYGLDRGILDANRTTRQLRDEMDEVLDSIKQSEVAAERLGNAFRDVGRDIDLAMSGGLEGVQSDIRDTIRDLNRLGGEFADVGAIGERALDDIADELDNDIDRGTEALFRLERQLREVADIGDRALEGLDDDARQAAASMGRLSRQADRAERSMSGMNTSVRRVSGDIRGMIYLLGAAGLGYVAGEVTRFGLDMTQQLEKSEAAFLGLTGSVEGANKMLETMVTFARETPYNLANVTQAAAQLLAVGDGFGVTAENVDDYLTTFGNALTITGGSEDQFIRIVRVLGQMSSTGKVLGQDMNQLAQNLPGFNVWQTLADGAGTSVQELRRLQDIGQLDELLTGDEAVQILIDGMEDIPGAAGAMERRMNTLGGSIEKFKETAQLALSEGLEPFSETAQDVLKDPVILNSVEDLAEGFGSLLSSGLEEVAPELDDLAVAVTNFLASLEAWTPVLEQVVDAVGDLLNFLAPLVREVGEAASSVLNFGDGLGKLAVAAGLFAAGGPIGIAGGVLFGVSGAMDLVAGETERAANMARLLAAAQDDLNDSLTEGEEILYSEAEQLAINTARDLRNDYGELANAMTSFNVTVSDIQDSMVGLADGTSEVVPEVQNMIDYLSGPNQDNKVIDQLEAITEAFRKETEEMAEEAEDNAEVLALAGVQEIAAREAAAEAARLQAEDIADYYDDMARAEEQRIAALEEAAAKQVELTDEQTEKITGLLQEQIDAYQEWEDGINGSTDSAALSLSSVAEEVENDVDKMIASINEQTDAMAAWKDNIVEAAVNVQDEFGLTDEQAQEFMGTLGEMGIAAAPALQAMLDDFESGGSQLEDFFNAVTNNSNVMSEDLTDAFDKATGSVPTLAEALSEDTVTIDDVLAALPEAMETAGLDMEEAAELIDLAEEFEDIGWSAVDGLVIALNDGQSRVRVAASNLAGEVDSAARQGLNISSPSRVMAEIGEFAVEGLIVGFQSMSDESFAAAQLAAKIMATGVERYFQDAEDPQEAARDFAQDVADTIVNELISEQEAVADAAEALANAAADRLSEAWDDVRQRFRARDIAEAISEAKADLAEARSELRSAQTLAGAEGAAAQAAAERRVARAEASLAAAEAADDQADRLAEQTLTNFRRGTEDAVEALQAQQLAEEEALEARIATATRNLDPVARAAAEAELEAALERHEAEMTALERRREDEEVALRERLDNEDRIREEAIDAKQRELRAFEDALDTIVDDIANAIANIPNLRDDIAEAERDVQEAFFDQFERLLDSADTVDTTLLRRIGAQAGLTSSETNNLIDAARASIAADAGAAAAAAGVDQLMTQLTSGVSLMTGAVDRLVAAVNGNYAVPTTSQLVDSASLTTTASGGSLVTMYDTVIQDATDADLVAQRVGVALSATGSY